LKRSLLLSSAAAAIVAMSSPSLAADSATQFGTDGFDFAWAAAADATGTYVVGGTAGTFPGATSGGGNDAFLAHMVSGGDVDWIHQFGGEGTDTANGVTAAEGAVYVVGDDDLASGLARGFVRRYTPDGALTWSRRIVADDDTYALGVAADATGVYVVGETFGTVGLRSRGRMDVFLRRYDVDGSVVWTRQLGTRVHDNAGHAVALAGDALYFTVTSGAVASLHRVDTDGDHRWRTKLGQVVFLYGAAADGSGVFVAGADYGLGPGTDFDALVVAVGSHGHVRWRSRFGERARDSWDTAGPVVINGDRVFVAGDTSGDLTSGGTQQTDDYDAFVRAFDPRTGEGLRTWQFGTPKMEFGNGAAIWDGNLTVVGATRGAFPGEIAMGDWDVYAYRL
jgi:hypothetical protein